MRFEACRRVHACRPSSEPIALTKASSRLVFAGLRAQFVGACPAATTLPVRDHHDAVTQRGDLLHDVAGEDHAAALAAQLAQEVAQAARGHHVQAVGRLVEDHVAAGRAPARARSRSWCAGPARSLRSGGRGSPPSPAPPTARAVRRAIAPAACRAARRSSDVLARGQALVDAARVGQHAERAARALPASRAASMPSTSTRPLSGLHQRVEHAQRGGLAGAVGAEQAGDLAVARASKPTSSTATTRFLALPLPGKVLRRCSATIMCECPW